MISSSRKEEMSSGTDEMEAELDAGGKAGLQDFRYALRKIRKDCEKFARIAKNSQGLRKFRNLCENFSMHSFSRSEISQIRYHSESCCA